MSIPKIACTWLIGAFLGASLTFGQSESGFEVPGSSTIPQDVELDKYLQPTKIWVAAEGYRPRYAYRENAREVPGYTLRFMQPLFVVRRYQDAQTQREYLLLAKSTDQRTVSEMYGWVNKEICVLASAALVDPGTSLHLKVRLVNTIASIDQALKTNQLDLLNVTLRLAPHEAGPVGPSFVISNLFFVYAETETHLLLGVTHYFDPTSPAAVVKGWVAKNRASRWNTRIAVEWDRATTEPKASPRRTERGLLFDTADAAHDFAQGKPLREQDVSFREVFLADGTSEPMPYNELRYAVLQNLGPDRRGRNELYRLGYVGKFMGSSEFNLADLDEKLRTVVNEAQNLEILVVVNDTEGMEPYFKEVGQTLQVLLGGFLPFLGQRGDLARKLRLAVAYYGDKEHSNSGRPFKTNPLQEIRNREDMDRILGEISRHEKDGGGDAPDDVLEGIATAIREAKFSKDANRLVITIGDMGDKSFPCHDDVQKRQEQATRHAALMADLVAQLQPPFQPSTIAFYAIQVETLDPKLQGRRHPDAVRYELDMKEIVHRLGGEEAGKAAFGHSSTREELRKRIVERIENLQDRAQQIIDQARAWRQGQFGEVGAAVRERFTAHGIDVEKVQALKGAQVYQEAFAWRDLPPRGSSTNRAIRQLRPVAFLEKADLEEVVRILDALVGPRSAAVRQRNFGDLVREEVDRLAGEKGKGQNQSLDDVHFRKLGLPIKSPLLRLRPGEFDDRPPTPNEIRELKLKLARLKDILGKESEGKSMYKNWHWAEKLQESGEIEQVLVFDTATLVSRGFSLKGDPYDNLWYWIDLEKEWP